MHLATHLQQIPAVGHGRDRRTECVNADIRTDVGADWIVDISKLSYGEVVQSPVDLVTIRPGMFSKIIALDVLEHIPDLVAAMTNCRDLLEMGGEMHISVPYDLSLGAWQDPTSTKSLATITPHRHAHRRIDATR